MLTKVADACMRLSENILDYETFRPPTPIVDIQWRPISATYSAVINQNLSNAESFCVNTSVFMK